MTGRTESTRYLIRGGRIYDHDGDIHQPATADLLIRGGTSKGSPRTSRPTTGSKLSRPPASSWCRGS